MKRLAPAHIGTLALVTGLGLMCISDGIRASDGAPAASSAQGAQQRAGDEIVCKRLKPQTGSRLGSRQECRSRAEWDARSRDSQQALENAPSRRAPNEVSQ